MRALILEDNRDRRVAMIGRLAERFPFLHVDFFDTSEKMIEFMQSDRLQEAVMISLDHDLEMIPGPQGKWTDPGTGLDVARWLAKRPKPLCPVIVHTTNAPAGSQMIRLLEKSHWIAHRVIPHDDLDWIDTEWFPAARNAIVDFAPQRRPNSISGPESKIGMLRRLLSGHYESGQTFCRAAMTKITDAYVRDLGSSAGDAFVEVLALVGADRLTSALVIEGPVIAWVRVAGYSPGSLLELAEQGPLAIQQLPIDKDATEQLSQVGICHVQVCTIEIADMQALLVVSAAKSLATARAQSAIAELKQALEIAVFVGLHWPRSAKASELPQEIKKEHGPIVHKPKE